MNDASRIITADAIQEDAAVEASIRRVLLDGIGGDDAAGVVHGQRAGVMA